MPDRKTQQVHQKRKLIRQLDSLKQEDETLYNVLAVDVWALAKTIEEFKPGFWAIFMKNRDKALKQFLNETEKAKETNTRQHPFLD